ncbi:MAG: Tat pathway signal protein [Cytophagales bacterium]|nr:Tat pathway signal protein [Cytophagales bacterium]
MDKRSFLKQLTLTAGSLYFLPQTGWGKTDKMNSKNWIWIHNKKWTNEEWRSRLSRLKEIGIGGILLGENHRLFERLFPIVDDLEMELHAWMWTMNRPNDPVALKHPDWYAVNRNGLSTYKKENRPYVDYYQWLCPSNEEVISYLEERVEKLCQMEKLQGVHLDYVRYPDVILPKALQSNYGLVQDKEFPEFDYCYCPTCQAKFKKEYGEDLSKMKDPSVSKEWKQFRYDRITKAVNRLASITNKHSKMLTAAVFPHPDKAREIVRQSWDDWNLDAVFPMIYYNFYGQGVPWVGSSTKKGVRALKNHSTNRALYSGLYLPELKTESDFLQAVKISLKNGAKGVAVFDYNSLKPHHRKVFKQLTASDL